MHESTRYKIYKALDKWHWRTINEIAELSGLSTRTLYRNLNTLVDRGEISRTSSISKKPSRFCYRIPRLVYVAEYGSDEFGNGSINMPFATIDRAGVGIEGGDQIRALIHRRLDRIDREELSHV